MYMSYVWIIYIQCFLKLEFFKWLWPMLLHLFDWWKNTTTINLSVRLKKFLEKPFFFYRERHKARKSLQDEQTWSTLNGLYFHGRKDRTLVQVERSTNFHKQQKNRIVWSLNQKGILDNYRLDNYLEGLWMLLVAS